LQVKHRTPNIIIGFVAASALREQYSVMFADCCALSFLNSHVMTVIIKIMLFMHL